MQSIIVYIPEYTARATGSRTFSLSPIHIVVLPSCPDLPVPASCYRVSRSATYAATASPLPPTQKQPLKRMLLPPCRERPALFHFNCELLWVGRMIEQGWWTLEDRLVYICDCVQPLIMACHVLSCMWCTLSTVAVLHYRDGEKGAILSER